MSVTLIGGEMLWWSDLDGAHGIPPAGGSALRHLVATAAGRTLVVGPHDPALIDRITVGPGAVTALTWLVRGMVDADTLAVRYADRPSVTVCCGSLEKLAAQPGYDTVVALDGVDRLGSVEIQATWDETLTRLLALLRPPGLLLLGVVNTFGVHRLLSVPGAPADTDWIPVDDFDLARPRTLDGLRARLAELGTPVAGDYAVYPDLHNALFLAGADVLSEPSLAGYLQAALGAAVAPGPGAGPPRPALTDPGPLVAAALRHGLASALAPAWIVQATAAPVRAMVVPAAVVAGAILARDPDGTWTDASGVAIPVGRPLCDVLLSACQRRALPVLRELLTAWQGGPAAGISAHLILLDKHGRFHPLGPAGDPVQALRQFAAMVIAGGFGHLWPAPASGDEPELTALLAGMTGRDIEPAGVPPADPAALRPGEGVRELIMARDRLTRAVADARAQHEFYERTIASRDAELRRVRLLNAALAVTAPGRAVTAALRSGRAAVRHVRAAARGHLRGTRR